MIVGESALVASMVLHRAVDEAHDAVLDRKRPAPHVDIAADAPKAEAAMHRFFLLKYDMAAAFARDWLRVLWTADLVPARKAVARPLPLTVAERYAKKAILASRLFNDDGWRASMVRIANDKEATKATTTLHINGKILPSEHRFVRKGHEM